MTLGKLFNLYETQVPHDKEKQPYKIDRKLRTSVIRLTNKMIVTFLVLDLVLETGTLVSDIYCYWESKTYI